MILIFYVKMDVIFYILVMSFLMKILIYLNILTLKYFKLNLKNFF